MRVFLCAFGDFALAIPMSCVSALTNLSANTAQREAVAHDGENGNTYISLPKLFGLPPENIRHGVVMNRPDGETGGGDKNKTVLLSPEIVREIDIPDEQIFPLPKVLDGTHFSELFSGVQLAEKPVLLNPVLVLDPERLARYVKKEIA